MMLATWSLCLFARGGCHLRGDLALDIIPATVCDDPAENEQAPPPAINPAAAREASKVRTIE
jgi:hypothetical protein